MPKTSPTRQPLLAMSSRMAAANTSASLPCGASRSGVRLVRGSTAGRGAMGLADYIQVDLGVVRGSDSVIRSPIPRAQSGRAAPELVRDLGRMLRRAFAPSQFHRLGDPAMRSHAAWRA